MKFRKCITRREFVHFSCSPKEGRACLIDHQQWHLLYDILENKTSDVKKPTENIGSLCYCHEFDPFKSLV